MQGWYEWLHGGKHKSARQVSQASWRIWRARVAGGAILPLPMWMILRQSGSSPVMDAATTAYSIVGQFLLNFKITENWVVWAVVDVIYVVIHIQQALYVTAALYALFVILCVKGYIDWRKTAVAALEATA